MNTDSLHIARQKRGQIEGFDCEPFLSLSDEELANLLQSNTATDRTIGATLLGQRRSKTYVTHLCDALRIEKALYAKMAICQSLKNIGKESVEALSKLLGTIGDNQETELPKKYFEKKSYPLARDIAARTLITIGEPAIDTVIKLSATPDPYLLSQIIDTLGGLLHKTKEARIFKVLIAISKREQQNELLVWKVIRALSAVKDLEATNTVLPFLRHSAAAVRWEAIRTIGLTADQDAKTVEMLEAFLTDPHLQIRQAARDSIARIKKGNRG